MLHGCRIGKHLRELFHCAPDLRLYRSQRPVQMSSDFALCHPGEIRQLKQVLVISGELAQSLPDSLPLKRGDRLIRGIGISVDEKSRWVERFAVFIDGRSSERLLAAPPEQVDRAVPRDPEQPSGERTAAGIVSIRVLPDAEEDIVGRFLSEPRIPKNAAREPVHRCGIAVIQRGKGVSVALSQP